MLLLQKTETRYIHIALSFQQYLCKVDIRNKTIETNFRQQIVQKVTKPQNKKCLSNEPAGACASACLFPLLKQLQSTELFNSEYPPDTRFLLISFK